MKTAGGRKLEWGENRSGKNGSARRARRSGEIYEVLGANACGAVGGI